MRYDFCVIGGGIVGLATAMALLDRQPGASLLLLEKETGLGRHQTSHNSGVIHAGIYYPPGSLKADLCRRGAIATKAFATEHGIPFEVCGKLLVATTPLELDRADALYKRSQDNGIEVQQLDADELRAREPNVRGLGALFVPSTGIIDYSLVVAAMAKVVRARGGEIVTGAAVTAITEDQDQINIHIGTAIRYAATRLIACAGLQADRVAKMAGMPVDFQIVPFRGEYYQLPPARNDIVRHLIYPLPDPDLPFLGVHLTRMIDGSVTVGPNAVLGMAREKYAKGSFDRRDFWEYARFPGAWRVARNNVRTGAREMRNSVFKRGYLRECQKYCPSLTVGDLQPYEAGIRAQAVLRDGTLVHDFLFQQTDRMLHVCNAPSPAATSAIPIGEMITDKLLAA